MDLIAIDTSAIVAIVFGEDDRALYAHAIERADRVIISAVTRVELSFVVEGRKGAPGRLHLERILAGCGAQVADVTALHAMVAIEAFRKFGKGRHPAALNIGDCFSYAVAMTSGCPLLFKGGDFPKTDVRSALD